MKLKTATLGLLFICAALPAAADEMIAIDAYYIPSADLEFGDDDDFKIDGDGFGAKGRVNIPFIGLFGVGEWQQVDYDDDDDDDDGIDQWRVGGGIGFALTPLVTLYGQAEYITFEPEGDDTGAEDEGQGFHGGLRLDVIPNLMLGARLGYVRFDDGDGSEYLFEAAYEFLELAGDIGLGAFADYRVTRIEDEDTGFEIELADVRVGARVTF
jgi:hypothetical protein